MLGTGLPQIHHQPTPQQNKRPPPPQRRRRRRRAPLRAAAAGDKKYIIAIIDKAEQALQFNLLAAQKAQKRSCRYYSRPKFDRFTGMWDYDADEKAK